MAESRVGFLASPSPSVGCLGSAVSSPSGVRGRALENLDFGAFWNLRNHVRTVSELLNLGEGATSESGSSCPRSNVEPPLFVVML